MKIIENNTLNKVKLDNPKTCKNLTIFPIIAENIDLNIKKFLQTIENNTLNVSEVSQEGSVPLLNFKNENNSPVFLIDGQTITGEKLKQNRIITVSTLLPPKEKTTVSVLCSERGRWSRTDREFASRDSSMFAKARFSKMETMSSRSEEDSNIAYDQSADQQQAWEQINRKFSSFNDFSSSESMQDIYKNKENVLKEFERELIMPENAVGAIFAIGSRVLGFELFSNHDLFSSHYTQLLKSYALDAIEKRSSDAIPSLNDAKQLLNEADNSVAKQCKNNGLGNLFTINTDNICATVLILNGSIIHFTCFSKKMREEL